MVRIGYLSVGYYVVCFSTALSLLALVAFDSLWNWGSSDWLTPIISFTLIQVFVIVIQVSGLILCLYGYKKKGLLHSRLLVNIFLVFWGMLVAVWAYSAYNINVVIEWYRVTEVSNPSFWYSLEFGTWAFKGLMWTLSGLVFMLIDYIQGIERQNLRST